MKTWVLSVMAAAVLSACGGSGDGDNSAGGGGGGGVAAGTTLAGTAAGGAPIVGVVTVKDSLGATRETKIKADGTYSVDVSGMTGPFMLRATGTVGTNSVTYYSAATSADLDKTVNVTPFTNLLISNIAAKLAETYYNEGNFGSAITSTSLDAAISSLQQKLAPALQALGLSASIDLLRSSFTADHTGLDAALDLIKVSIDPATNVATLTNALTNAKIGEDRLNDRTDDTTSVTLSDAEKNLLGGAKTDMQNVQTVLNQFAALFSTSLPSINKLQASGIFAADFMMGGADFEDFASDVSEEAFLIGMKLTASDLTFEPGNQNRITANIRILLKGDVEDHLQFVLVRADASSPWKIAGDQRVADISVEPMSVYTVGGGSSMPAFTSGVQMYAEIVNYNANHDADITSAVLTGPGLPAGGVKFVPDDTVPYLVIEGTYGGNIVPECQSGQTSNCINIAAMKDNDVYRVKLYAGTTLINGEGYSYTIGKKPYTSAELSGAMFPALTTLSIDGASVTQLSHFQANKNLSVSWTMPSGLRSDWLSVSFWGGSGEMIEEDLAISPGTTKVLALGGAPTGASGAQVWLAGRDVYQREFVLQRLYR